MFRRLALATLVTVLANPAKACTTFLLERGSDRVVGKSYDWHMGQGLVIVNKRGVSKQAFPAKPDDRPARWVSRHASVTFNQYGRELPNGGMNDAGLVVEIMWLDSSRYEAPDQRETVNELQWIQYQLDSFATVAEMITAAPRLRVSSVYAAVHYLACDKTGACAAFEHLRGKQVVTPGARVLTNHSYADSIAWTAKQRQLPGGLGSLERFARASRQIAASTTPEGNPVTTAFGILDGVRGSTSQWNIVYDPVRLQLHFRTLASPRIKSLDLGKLDPSCGQAVALVDIDDEAGGDVAGRLRPYDDRTNRALIARSLRPIAGQLPPGSIDKLAAYPSVLACTAP